MTMPRTYAAKRLLEHGPLTAKEFLEITGWAQREADRALQQLMDTGLVTCNHPWGTKGLRNYRHRNRVYALASSISVEKCGHLTATTQKQPMQATESDCLGSIYPRQSDDLPKIHRAFDRTRGDE